MKNHWKMAVWLAGFALVTAAPFLVKADGSNFGVKIGDDNEAHYRFRDRRVRHDPQMLQAARLLAAAKERLWYLRDGFNGHRSAAVASINRALDEISAAENGEGRWGRAEDRPRH